MAGHSQTSSWTHATQQRTIRLIFACWSSSEELLPSELHDGAFLVWWSNIGMLVQLVNLRSGTVYYTGSRDRWFLTKTSKILYVSSTYKQEVINKTSIIGHTTGEGERLKQVSCFLAPARVIVKGLGNIKLGGKIMRVVIYGIRLSHETSW